VSPETVRYLIPEIILLGLASAVYLAGAFWPARRLWSWVAFVGLAASAMALLRQEFGGAALGAVTSDPLAHYGRWLALLSGGLLVLMGTKAVDSPVAAEYQASLLLAVSGLMLTATAWDLVLLFVALELISISTYLLLYLGREGNQAKEAAAKYFYLSVLSSALMLYGFSFIYGIAGSTYLPRVQGVLLGQSAEIAGLARLAPLALVLLFAGLGFKMAAAPFQFYAPDVYQGTSHANAALLSVLPKAAALIAVVRIVGFGMPGEEAIGWRLAMALGALSMTFGNVLALWQTNLRRLLAYSSIAHVGYMLIGLATGFALSGGASAGGLDGFGAMFFYLLVYAIATIGAFATLIYLGSPDESVETIDDLTGAGHSHPWAALALAVFLFSLAGIPPLAGYWGKLFLFFSAINISEAPGEQAVRAWFVGLAVLGVLNAAIAATYYLRIIGALWFRTGIAPPRGEGGWTSWLAMAAAAVLVLGLGIFPGPLVQRSNDAGQVGRPRAAQPASATITRSAAPAEVVAKRAR
jgi:NADH-quinone oxidoreductase subunit N